MSVAGTSLRGVGALALLAAVALASLGAPVEGASAPSPAPIGITINGDALPLKPPPALIGGVLFVPIRRIVAALGLPFSIAGARVSTTVGAKTVTLTRNSRFAQIDGRSVTLDAPVTEIHGALYAPLRFFTDVLGAQARFDRRANTVTIIAQLVGRSGIGIARDGNRIVRFGSVDAVDVLSNPPTVTLGYNGAIQTIPISANALVERQDVSANVSMPGDLGDVRPGDFARIEMTKKGRVVRVVDEYGSRSGRIVAAAGGSVVLADGEVIVPTRTTEVAIDGVASAFSDLRPGDMASVRYNVETNEVGEVLASRSVPRAAAAPGALAIASVVASADHPLRPGDVVRVRLRGTPGASATFDIGSFVVDQAMHERAPGEYEGSYAIPRGANFADAPVIGRLAQGTQPVASMEASTTISASGTPPGIGAVAPDAGAVVNNARPAIFATFAAGAVAVDPTSASLWVDGRNVTSECMRTAQFIEYFPGASLRDGTVRVRVRVADRAGNAGTKSWSFRIGR